MSHAGSHGRRRSRRRRRQRLRVVALLGGAAILGVAIGAVIAFPDLLSSSEPPSAPSTKASTDSPTASSTPAQTREVDKAVVFVIENRSAAQIRTDAPRLTALAAKYGEATHALAPCGHPSQPNYVCLSTGGKYVSSNTLKTLPQPDIWNNTVAAGRTMKVYADGLPAAVDDRRKEVGQYVARHVFTAPFVATQEKADNFVRYTVDADTLAGQDGDIENGDLPNVGAIIPDNCHNAHDRCRTEGATQIGQADDWIADRVGLLQQGPDWKSGRLLIIVTADEDDKEGVNDIPMIAIHPSLRHHATQVPVDLYSVGGLLADVGNTPRLGKQRSAPDFAKAFDLTVTPAS
jgi:phosphatidylinositol-3-phosphatase